MRRSQLNMFGAGAKGIFLTLSKQNRPFYWQYGNRFLSTNQTMDDVRQTLGKWLGSSIRWSATPPDRSHLLKYLPNSQEELPIRSHKDSYSEAIIPLSTNLQLQHRYVTATGRVRMGRVLEDMDLFAVYIALKHIKNPKQDEELPSPYVIVTAAVDNIQYTLDKPFADQDVKLTGKVVLVGQSSMDIYVEMFSKLGEKWNRVTIAQFKMAARNSTLTKAAFVNKLKPDGPEEEMEMKNALGRKKKRTEDDRISLLHSPPSPEEQKLIHENFIKSVDLTDPTINKRILPKDHVWMDETRMYTSVLPHPEHRNHHNSVFGGYLMRMSLQLAWMAAYNYSLTYLKLRPGEDDDRYQGGIAKSLDGKVCIVCRKRTKLFL